MLRKHAILLSPHAGEGTLTQEDFQTKVLAGVDSLTKKYGDLETALKTGGTDIEALKKCCNALQLDLVKLQKQQALARLGAVRRTGEVDPECAQHIACVCLGGALLGNRLTGKRSEVEAVVKDFLGAEWRTALTSSDTPLPTQYSGQIVELVGQYGVARNVGTTYPMGTGTVKLPRIKTDPTFGLLTIATAVDQKSPQLEWVTFTAEKYGGLILLPSEIDADSIVSMGQFIARYAARNLARAEDQLFFMADGTATYSSVSGLAKLVVTNGKVAQLGKGNTTFADVNKAAMRAVRGVVDAPALGNASYVMHPSWEQFLRSHNTAGDLPFSNGMTTAGSNQGNTNPAPGLSGCTYDGLPIRWSQVMPAYDAKTVNASTVPILFGDFTYMYLGTRGAPSVATSLEAGFAADLIYVRALERIDAQLMANGAIAGIQTAAE